MRKRKRIAVKIGSNVITRKDGGVDVTRLSAIVDQVATLVASGIEVILISSGAVASGRGILTIDKKLDSVSARQLFSSVGQAKLINRYYDLFKEYGIVCGQVLTTKENFGSRNHYLTQKSCMGVMLEAGVIPIVNENDTVSVTELMFTDNDELAGLIATMMNVDTLLILSNIDGIFDGDPSSGTANVIREITPHGIDLRQHICTGKSHFGRGGMLTKCNIARKVAKEGIEVIIANGAKDNILTDIMIGEKEVLCSRFVPSAKVPSGLKKWIAHSDSFAKGRVVINDGACESLRQEGISILFVGVTSLEGEFAKGDIVNIYNTNKEHIAVGVAAFSSKQAQEMIGQHKTKPFVHYNYLYLLDS